MQQNLQKKVRLAAGDALIAVDVQNDFLPGGAVAVPGACDMIPTLNNYIARFVREHLPVFATRDWHPVNHSSFQSQGGSWPIHCLADSKGAQFPSTLLLPPWTVVISKGGAPDTDGYSAFDSTELEQRLRVLNLHRLFIGGLATDYCVLHTVEDALSRGAEVFVLRDAIRAVNRNPDDGRNAENKMLQLGAASIEFKDLSECDYDLGLPKIDGHSPNKGKRKLQS